MRNTYVRGFTIIELLVAVAIIGILSATILVYLDTTRAKGRDTRRLSDIHEIQKAIHLYYASNQRYPIAATEIVIDSDDSLSIELEAGGYISNTPRDPRYPATEYRYVTDLFGRTYTITFCMETDSHLLYAQGCSNTITP